MTLTSSLSNALSGLTANARTTEVISSNISNALTEGYGRRDIELGTRSTGRSGAGVRVVSVDRVVDQQVIADRRLADAAVGARAPQLEFVQSFARTLGTPEEAGSLSAEIADFEAALISAAGRPDSAARLNAVLEAAQSLTTKFNVISDEIQQQRVNADQAINQAVETLNTTLVQIETISTEITRQLSAGYDASALLDQRQVLIDRVSELVPVKEIDRGNGQIALLTPTGGLLLDRQAAELSFSPVGVITADMTLQSGALSGLQINGRDVDLTGNFNAIAGGRLEGLFIVRDELAVTEQARLDSVARDLISRFEDPAVDPTLAPGAPGLFTDNGAALDPTQEIGLAGRISVNALADPGQGGALFRLRDGLGAATAGEVGNASLLNTLVDTLNAAEVPVSGGFSGAARSVTGLTAEFVSFVGIARESAEAAQSFAIGQAEGLKELELRNGVDNDQEIQRLLLVEQAYGANARVVQTVDDLIQTLLAI